MSRLTVSAVVVLLAIAAVEFAVLAGVPAGALQDAAPHPSRALAGVPPTATPTPANPFSPPNALATFRGTVTDGQGAPIPNAELRSSGHACCYFATTDADGEYEIVVPAGDSTLSYGVYAAADGYVSEYYDNALDINDATLIPVQGGDVVEGIDFSLAVAGSIAGTITNVEGEPLAPADVVAEAKECCFSKSWFALEGGQYVIDGLPAGQYRVHARYSVYARRLYDNVYSDDEATLVTVVEGATIPGIDIQLELGATISGVIRDESAIPVEGAFIQADRVECCGEGFAVSGPNGAYTMSGLAPGDYIVRAGRFRWLTKFYPDALTPEAASPVTASAGQTVTDIDITIRPLEPDDWREAIQTFGVPFAEERNTAGSGLDDGEQQPCGNIAASVWYAYWAFEGPDVGQVTVDTLGSDFDTVIAIYTDVPPSPPSGPPSLAQLVGCNDDAASSQQSSFTWAVEPEEIYYIQVGGKDGASGNLDFEISCPVDIDCDGVLASDNCPLVPNVDQLNTDSEPLVTVGVGPTDTSIANSDGFGDICDDDDDNDGLNDDEDPGNPDAFPESPPSGCEANTLFLEPLNPDTDGDGVRDGAECALGSDPTDAGSKPALPGAGNDDDGDGLHDGFEAIIGSNPNDNDSDDDGVLDGIEYKGYTTSSVDVDTDGDGCDDDAEIASVDANPAVNAIDLLLVAQQFLKPDRAVFDVNKDGIVNVLDLQLVAKNFNPAGCGTT